MYEAGQRTLSCENLTRQKGLWARVTEMRVSLTKFFVQISLGLNSPCQVIRMSSLPPDTERHLSHGSLIFCFPEEKGRSEHPSCTCCF